MRYLYGFLALFVSSEVYGQVNVVNTSLTDTSLNILYIGVENIMMISRPGYPHGEIKLTVSGQDSEAISLGPNQYALSLKSPGQYEVVCLLGQKPIFKKTFQGRFTYCDSRVCIAGMYDTTIRLSRLLGNPFVSVITPGCYYNFGYRILSFTATFIQGYDSVSRQTPSNQFSQEQLKLARELRSGDRIYFDAIKVVSRDGRIASARPFWIKIE